MPPAKKAAAKRPTLAARKTKRATKLGYGGDVGAMKAVTRQYGLVKDEAGTFRPPSADFLESQLAAQGYGKGQTVANPINIGGMRVLSGAGQLIFTGERSDAAKRNPGAAYGAEGQVRYSKSKAKGKRKGRPEEKGFATGGELAAADQAYEPYAEADTTTTGMARAQGKAYAASRAGYGGSREGQTSSPTTEESPATKSRAGRKGKGPKKAKPKRSPASRRRTARAKKK